MREPCAGASTALVVNDYRRAAATEADVRHVHLGQEDLVEVNVDVARREELTVGLSTHDAAELGTAPRAKPDYVGRCQG
jgi:thiamine-phosphate pyrophosphorylase